MEHPRSAAGIRSRVGEIVFGQPLERELALLEARRSPPLRLSLTRRQCRLARHRLHVLDGGEAIAGLDPATRVLANHQTLDHLRDVGRTAATRWLHEDQKA
jgi:NTE family protein